ncbi:hypothetical protein BCR43DRAFT_539616 [Syncephalastrum racemosum]|uniref:Reverse transcriptase domain-containing protein n=1 Tax=Syncephalastrum racemosum TaxID=13706 RepID=A0A1X2GYX4_SYNRA|nr:hypothetical protein BCR43DRAFT_539616 [Syncephalastrum racemosum]
MHHATFLLLRDELRHHYNPYLTDDYDDQAQASISYVPVNCLLYADDVALVGHPSDVQRMLDMAEVHSNMLGYRWSPTKCMVLNAPPDASFKLYDQPLPTCESFKYLGIPFNKEGIDTTALLQHSTQRAITSMRSLRDLGVHTYGFGLGAATRAYQVFVRPILEYGLAIASFSDTQHNTTRLERAQRQCLRLCMARSHQSNMGTVHIATMSGLPPMAYRRRRLQALFIARALSLLPDTLLYSVIRNRRQPSRSFLTSPWSNLLRSDTWATYRRFCRNPPHPKADPLAEALKHHLKAIMDREIRTHVTLERGLTRVERSPVLYLPCTRKERHRLIKWRISWLPPKPYMACACGAPEANRNHLFSACPLILPEVHNFTALLDPPPPASVNPLDFTLNQLPKTIPLSLGRWQTLWPALLSLLRRIDQVTSDGDFESEPPAGELLLEASRARKQAHFVEPAKLLSPPAPAPEPEESLSQLINNLEMADFYG